MSQTKYVDFLNPHSGRISHLKPGQRRYKQAIDEGWQRLSKEIQPLIRKDIGAGVDTKEPDYLRNLETRIRTHPYQLTYKGETTYYRTEAERQRYIATLQRFSATSPYEYPGGQPFSPMELKQLAEQRERGTVKLGSIEDYMGFLKQDPYERERFQREQEYAYGRAYKDWSKDPRAQEQLHKRREAAFTEAYGAWLKDPIAQKQYHERREAAWGEWFTEVQEAAGGRDVHFDPETGGYYWFEEEPEEDLIKGQGIPGPAMWRPGSLGASISEVLSPPVVQALGSLESILGAPSAWLRKQPELQWKRATEAEGRGDLVSAQVLSTGARMSGVGASVYDFLTFPVRPSMWIGAGALASGLVLSPKVREEVSKEIMKDPLQFGIEMVGGYVGATALAPLVVRGGGVLTSKSYEGLKALKGKAVSVKDVLVSGLREDFSWFNEVVSYSQISPEFVKPTAFDPSTAYFTSWGKGLARIKQAEALQVLKLHTDFISPQAYSPGVPSGILGEFRQFLKISPDFIKPLPFEAPQVYAFWQFLKIHPEFISPKAWAPRGPSGVWGSFKQVLKISTDFATPAYRTIEQTGWGKFILEVKAYSRLGTDFKPSGTAGVAPRVLDVSKSMKTILEQTSKAGTGKASTYVPGLPNLSHLMEVPQEEKYKRKKTTYTALTPPSSLYRDITIESVMSFPVQEAPSWSKRGSKWAQLESPYYRTRERPRRKQREEPSLAAPPMPKIKMPQLTGLVPGLKATDYLGVDVSLKEFSLQIPEQIQKQRQKQEQTLGSALEVPRKVLTGAPTLFWPEREKKRKKMDPLGAVGELRLRPVKFRKLEDVLKV